MTIISVIGQIIGFIAIGVNLIIYQQKNEKNLLIWKLSSDILWLVHYILISANAAAAIAVVSSVREIVLLKSGDSLALKKKWMVIFIVFSVVSGLLTWKGVFSVFPCVASVLANISFCLSIPMLSRIMSFPVSVCMLTYDIFSGSISGIVNEAFTIISSIIGIYVNDRTSDVAQKKNAGAKPCKTRNKF